jgi:uncharacterized protein
MVSKFKLQFPIGAQPAAFPPNADLRNAGRLATYFSFLKEGNLRRWNEFCFMFISQNYRPSDPAHGIDHLLRVLKVSFKIATEYKEVDQVVLLIACYFHDFVSFPKNQSLSPKSSMRAADSALKIFEKQPLTQRQKEKLHNAILAHSYSANLKGATIESDIIYDADKIDALGAIGIARLFCVSGALSSDPYDLYDPFSERRKLNDKQFAIDHFYKKILCIPEKMRTPEGRQLANDKVKYVKQFLEQIKEDIL